MKYRKDRTRLEYISSLEIATRYCPDKVFGKMSPVFIEESEDAKVVDGSAVSFISGIPIMQQQDVLNSTLLAQLGANKAFDREKNTTEWYGKYREVLANIGWLATSYNFENQKEPGNSVKLDTKSLSIVQTIASGAELTILTKTLGALENVDPDSKAATLFDQGGSQGTGGNFQLGTASLDDSGNVNLASGAFYFDVSEHQDRFLFFTWKTKDINFYAGVQRIILNEVIYSGVRQAIIDKLGDLAQTFVADLPI